MTQKKTWRSKYNDQDKINMLCDIVMKNIETIYEYFDVDFRRGETIIFSRCFIHGGDNTHALNLYYNADYRVHYKCRTHECEQHFGTSILSLVRGGLSHIKYGWTNPTDKTVSLDETIDFLLNKFNISFGDIPKIDTNKFLHQDFSRLIKNIVHEKPESSKLINKEFYRSKVEIPSPYFIDRGYSIEVLDDYDVGTCKAYGKEMYNRAVVPVYDEDGEWIIGFTGRSIFEQCEKCKSYHDPEKPCFHFPKWRHNKSFKTENSLYNYWKAKEHIQKTGVVILVESPGNVWRLEEAGINNSVAIFGTNLSQNQKQLLDESGALTIIVMMDNDENKAGQQAAIRIKEICEKTYRVYIVNINNKNDISEMNSDEVTNDVKPIIDEAIRAYKEFI